MTSATVAVYWSHQWCYVISSGCMLVSFLPIKLALHNKVFSFFLILSSYRTLCICSEIYLAYFSIISVTKGNKTIQIIIM